ncbi:MAG TPA: hypothetical protein VGK02_02700 [Candidatus Aquicultor sp.]
MVTISAISWQYLVAGFLVFHGIGHVAGFWVASGASRLVNRLDDTTIKTLGGMLWLVALGGFVAAGLGVLDIGSTHEAWRDLAIAASLISMLTMVLFTRLSLFGAFLADIVIIVALVWLQWPSDVLIGR